MVYTDEEEKKGKGHVLSSPTSKKRVELTETEKLLTQGIKRGTIGTLREHSTSTSPSLPLVKRMDDLWGLLLTLRPPF